MSTTESARAVQCPKCDAGYKLRADFQGKVKCRKCGTSFMVGLTKAERKGQASRTRTDNSMATRMVIIAVVALAIIGGLIAIASNTSSGTSADPVDRRKRGERLPDSYTTSPLRPDIPESKQPEIIAREFFKAMAAGDRQALDKLFMYEEYFKWFESKYSLTGEDVYANVAPEMQAAKREEMLDALLEPARSEYMANFLIPQIDRNEEGVWTQKLVRDSHAEFQVTMKDDRGQPLMLLALILRLKEGMDPATDGDKKEAWGVYKVLDQYLQATLGVAKADRRPRDVGARKRTDEIRAQRAAGGFPEADPAIQEPVPGTSDAQRASLEAAVAVVLNPSTSGRDLNAARREIREAGKPAIPFLLNGLVGRNHVDDEQEIIQSFLVIQLLRNITGMQFGFAPGVSDDPDASIATTTNQERNSSVRRWFGWWKLNKRSWTGKTYDDEEEEGEDR